MSWERNPARYFHETWLGMVQPTEGLVVSIPALLDAEAEQRLPIDAHRAFTALLEEGPADKAAIKRAKAKGEKPPAGKLRPRSPRDVLTETLHWGPISTDPEALFTTSVPEDLSLYIPEGPQTLRPTAVFRKLQVDTESPVPSPAAEAGRQYMALIFELPPNNEGDEDDFDFDKPEAATGAWSYPPAKKLERLMRETRVPIGILLNRNALRLIYAPHGEAAGHIDFRFADMADVGGRPILDAMVLLLGRQRLVEVPPDRQLAAILARSREMQAEVTTDLSKQVFFALETLLRGFEAADARAGGDWLRPVMLLGDSRDFEDGEHAEQGAAGDKDVLFDALLTVLLRLVFLLYAEDSGLLPIDNPLYEKHYSLYALYKRLEEERGAHAEAMTRRYSAWPGLLALFRVVYLGASHGKLQLPPRDGHLFDPHRFPFLEGFEADARAVPLSAADHEARAAANVPTVDDETVFQVLRSLIMLKSKGSSVGARLSYRALQVEQIGSVYEGLMGWKTLRIGSPSVRIKPSDSKHAPLWVSVEDLAKIKKAQREKWLKSEAGLKGKRAKELLKDFAAIEKSAAQDPTKNETVIEDLAARLEQERVKTSTLAQSGRIVIQPGEERKRTSSHYTPPELSGPIVARALEPLLKCFGEIPTSAQILSLKVCDPAMGSGAFLVEACRYLGERLLEAWNREGATQRFYKEGVLSEDDDLTVYARRQVAERCLYGVDKNPVAVELAKLSLWLVTLQKDKPFTFLDHSLRCGDALVGCDLDQILEFHWKPKKKRSRPKKGEQLNLFDRELELALREALSAREEIVKASRFDTAEANRDMRVAMRDADDALSRLRLIGDLLIGAFFAETKDKAREKERERRKAMVETWLLDSDVIGIPDELRAMADETRRELRPFHWMLEFPEVFWAGRVDPLTGEAGDEPAFLDAVVGNPPFMGGKGISSNFGDSYADWLLQQTGGSKGADICARFFLRARELIGLHGTFGLIATNSISESDNRSTALGPLVAFGGSIYNARVSIPWSSGDAAVTVSVVHVTFGEPVRHSNITLDGKSVPVINSRLRPTPERSDPVQLRQNRSIGFVGSYVSGKGFVLTPEARAQLVASDPKNERVTFPYLGGAEVNTSPTHDHNRFVIDFRKRPLDEAEDWPDVIQLVRELVKPERDKTKDKSGRTRWWQHMRPASALSEALTSTSECLVNSQVSKHLVFAFRPTDIVFAHTLNVFTTSERSVFATLQSRIHERWARLLASSMKTDLRYTGSDCFETFPFPKPSPKAEIPSLETIGKELYETRAKFMVDTDQGLTKTYNALKDPAVTARSENGERIVHLRQLHLQMDQAVLEAYAQETGDKTWTNIEIPPFTTPETTAEKSVAQAFEDHVLDKLFALNAERSRS